MAYMNSPNGVTNSLTTYNPQIGLKHVITLDANFSRWLDVLLHGSAPLTSLIAQNFGSTHKVNQIK